MTFALSRTNAIDVACAIAFAAFLWLAVSLFLVALVVGVTFGVVG
jgi:hypothetical protein